VSKAQLTTFQNIKLDSLKQIVATATNDSVKIYALIEIDNIIFLINDNQDLVVNLSIVDLCENKLINSSDYDNNIWYKNKLSISYNNIATHYGNINNYDKALVFYIKSLKIEEEIGTNNTISVTCNNISGIYKKQENYKAAIEYHEKSLIIEERMRMDLKKNFELKHQADSIKHADEILIQQANNLYKEEQLKSERQRINGLILITILILSSLALVFLQLKKVRKGKLLIEEKQKEITDSINYANRLQEGMLAPFNLVQEWLLQSFILYRPKDIVSGDFYWIEKNW
jgi:tetratricopeptide (TPR) repeat protein